MHDRKTNAGLILRYDLNWSNSRFIFKKLLVQVSQTLELVKVYMIVNFKTREINRNI